MHIQVLRSQRIPQRFRFLAPLIIQLFMVQQRNHRLIAHRGEVINLEQLMAQDAIMAHAFNHRRHQLVNQLAGRREAVDADTAFRLLIKNDVIQVVAVMPQAKFGAHPIMADWRAKHFRDQVRKRRHHTLQAHHFFG